MNKTNSLNDRGAWFAATFAAALMFLALPLAAAEKVTLQDIAYTASGGDQAQLSLTFSGPAPTPTAFTIDNPARLAIDLPDTTLGQVEKNQQLASGAARNIRAVQAGNRTRIVVGLARMVPYDVRVQNNAIHIAFGALSAPPAVAAGKPGADGEAPAPAPAKPAPLKAPVNKISNVDFRRVGKGAGRIAVTLTNPSVVVDMQPRGEKLVVEFFDSVLAENMVRRLDVADFATPVKTIDAFNREGNARLVIAPEGEYEHMAFQVGNTYTIEVKPITPEEKAARKKEGEYVGEKLSLNFQNIDVRAVLQLIGDFTGLNVVASDTVQGNITLRLKNVPWDQALEIILKAKGLGMRKNGNVVLIAPSEEIAAREKLELEARQQIEELAPLRTEFFQVNYAKAADFATLLKTEGNTLLSKRGNVTLDERTNTLMILDTADKLDEIRAVISRLDIPVRQVLIESRIVIANDDFSKSLGTRFGGTFIGRNGSDGLVTTTGSATGTDTTVGSALDNLSGTGALFPVTAPSLNDRLNVNLPLANPAGRIALAVLGSDYIVDLELSAMQSEGRGEVVSSPRVVTANQKKAMIEQGVEIPYLQASSSGATSVSFKKAVLSLEVTPQITPDDRIIMDLTVNKDSVGEIFSGIPSVDTREVQTQVLVANGDTVVLGGIYEQTRADQVTKVPFLGDLPVIGALFRTTTKVDDKAELLIFVTPKILKEGLNVTLN